MNKTKIDWTDWTWNPVTGCLHGCPYCYARATARRWGKSPAEKTFEPMFHPERISQVKQAKAGDKVFVCSMADLFGKWAPSEWIEHVLAEVVKRPDVIFQFLTKNPSRYLDFQWPENAWLGATATDDGSWEEAVISFPPGGIAFISCEPLLKEIRPLSDEIDWLIIGAQTGPQAFQPKEEWVKRLEDFADAAQVPVFHKDNLECRRGRARKEFPQTSGVTRGL